MTKLPLFMAPVFGKAAEHTFQERVNTYIRNYADNEDSQDSDHESNGYEEGEEDSDPEEDSSSPDSVFNCYGTIADNFLLH